MKHTTGGWQRPKRASKFGRWKGATAPHLEAVSKSDIMHRASDEFDKWGKGLPCYSHAHMGVAQKTGTKKEPGKWKHGPKPAVCPSYLALSHTHITQDLKAKGPSSNRFSSVLNPHLRSSRNSFWWWGWFPTRTRGSHPQIQTN